MPAKDYTKTFVVKAPEGPRPLPLPRKGSYYPTPPPVDFNLIDTLGEKSDPYPTGKIIEPPPELIRANEENPNWIHNWMYSIVPGPSFDIYLAGFCKTCRTAFTLKLKTASFRGDQFNYFPTETDVPKYGCVGPS